MNMCVGHRHLTWTLALLSGVVCGQWTVDYPQLLICAVKGSSVLIPCSFHHPDDRRPQKVVWGHVKYHQVKARFVFIGLWKSSRFTYMGDSYQNCSLKIHPVDPVDAGRYSVWMKGKGHAAAASIPKLRVIDLEISLRGNRTIKEGESVSLTCINSCDGDATFVWFKNGEAVGDGAVLYLHNVSQTSSGNYTCSLKTHTRATSGIVHINVEYAPRNTSASISADANVTLVCSSHANPPVEAYTWFRTDDGGSLVVGHEPVFSPGDGGRYFCSAANKHGNQNSSVVTVNTKAFWTTLPVDVLIVASVALLLTAAAVFIPRRLSCNRTGVVQNNISHQPRPRRCEVETPEVVYTAVYFNTHRNMEQLTASPDGEDGTTVIYSSVCR